MNLTNRHRRIARTIWECGGRLDEVARREKVRPNTLRKWLADPGFRSLLAEDALEPVLQATSALLRWAPAAVKRLIEELDSESAGDARQAAREILKLALDTQRELAGPAPGGERKAAEAPSRPGDDPLSQTVANLPDDQLVRILTILQEAEGDPR
jgi:transposase-like protein